MKSGLGRISESTGKYQGAVVYNMADVPLVSLSKLNSACKNISHVTMIT